VTAGLGLEQHLVNKCCKKVAHGARGVESQKACVSWALGTGCFCDDGREHPRG
jgi:hypothetical protein